PRRPPQDPLLPALLGRGPAEDRRGPDGGHLHAFLSPPATASPLTRRTGQLDPHRAVVSDADDDLAVAVGAEERDRPLGQPAEDDGRGGGVDVADAVRDEGEAG